MEMNPMDIERRSMAIIESELDITLPDEVKPIVMRTIHATADFSFAKSLYFASGAVALMQGMLHEGATVVTDTQMALSGINKGAASRLGVSLCCFMSDTNVADEAKARGVTRALVSMERALQLPGEKLLVCGNAPTFLLRLLSEQATSDVAVIGAPVGFVNVLESKEALKRSGIPSIIAMGRRGGSTVAAAIVNALMYDAGGRT